MQRPLLLAETQQQPLRLDSIDHVIKTRQRNNGEIHKDAAGAREAP